MFARHTTNGVIDSMRAVRYEDGSFFMPRAASRATTASAFGVTMQPHSMRRRSFRRRGAALLDQLAP
jgi:hypothetical protein